MRTNHDWTDDERDIIRRDYRHTRASAQEIANRLGVTKNAVAGQIAAMGLAKSDDRHPWSPREKEKLTELIQQYCPRRVAHIMHRSINSVTVMSKRLGISRRCRNGWFTKREVCEILGHDHKWVQRRIDSGALKATYHYDRRPTQLGGSAWHIDEQDLVRFIRRYPEGLVGCNIDIIIIVEILAGITNNH
ncbi:hypothetical protein ES703_98699 [subsurface metagenome]